MSTPCADRYCRSDGTVRCGDGKLRCIACYAENLEVWAREAWRLLDTRLSCDNQDVPQAISVSRTAAKPVHAGLADALELEDEPQIRRVV